MYFQRYCFVLSENSELLKRDSSVLKFGVLAVVNHYLVLSPRIIVISLRLNWTHDEEYPLKKLGAGVK